MNALITGGTGFIGSHLTESLAAEGHTVTVVDNYETSRRDALSSPPESVEIVEADIRDRQTLAETFDAANPSVVIHCAASYDEPENWTRDASVNVEGTVNVVQESERLDVDRLVYFQTALCYGTIPREQPVTLDHPLEPDVSYAISKTAGEQYISASDLSFVSFRLANFYGPRNLSGPIPTFYKRLSEGKSCFVTDTRRDFIFIDDLVPLVMQAVAGRGEGHYHVSTGEDSAIKEVYQAVADRLGVDMDVEERPRAEDDAPTLLLDPSRTHEDFEWDPTTSLEEGVARTIDWYEEHGVEQTYTHLNRDEE